MVVRDLDFMRIAILPTETHAILLIDTNALLTAPAAFQTFKPVAWRHRQVAEITCPVDLIQLPPGNCPQNSRAGLARGRGV